MRWRWSNLVGPVVAVAVVAAGVLSGLVPAGAAAYREWTHRIRAMAAEIPGRVLAEQGSAVSEDAAVIALVADDGSTSSIALVAGSAEAVTVVVMPVTLYDVAPGFGELALGEALEFGGPETLRLTVANAFDVRVDDVVVLEASELPELVGDAVEIDLPAALVVEDDAGTLVEVASAGLATRDGSVVAALLSPSDDPVADLSRQAATWEAVVARLGRDPATVGAVAANAERGGAVVSRILAAARAGPTVATIAPVEQVGGRTGRGFVVDRDALGGFLEARVPGLVIAPEPRPRTEVLNGNGRLQTTRTVASRLIESGYRIVRVDNADRFDHPSTIVIAQGRSHADPARRVVTLLGVGELRLELRAPSGAVDISIIVGRDVPAGEG